MSEPTEKDFLVYRGNAVPRVIRFVWSVLLLFCVVYLVKYAWPNFLEWVK